ncbi:cytoskeleton-associated protein CAP5.5 [Trypanosoma cruzi marinkellei]|uniref:Cytoskeleton-associated protein CAP5.5 n=1 Tax=Trypanosoma cruzi marinkellei TaxID=85056 RepID=K2NFL2_TRYCR|nr:cytoskeleton-associated protein CAP5.5 [Trypanosoma cruzi marinkellei]
MGCCASKEKQPKPQAAANPVAVQKGNTSKAPAQAPMEDVVKIEVVNQKQANVPEEVLERLRRVMKARQATYKYGKCTVEGDEGLSFFPPRGLCHLIKKGDTWFLHNDTMNYEMHVSYQFSPDSNVIPLGSAVKKDEDDGSTIVSVVVYPLDTVEFLSGETGIYKSDVFAQALSEEYRQGLQILTQPATEELQKVIELADGSMDDEEILGKCVETSTPYVDLSFQPSEKMLYRPDVDGRPIALVEMRRSTECHGVNRGKVGAICGPVIPQCIDPGHLCDNWLMCAMAALAEDKERVKEIFALCSPEETRLGAYRLSLNKNGWWKTVLLDDFLPTVNEVPCFARVLDDPSELWVSLLQKAYAKLHGSYSSITGGDASHALRDFTGAPSYRFDEAWVKAAKWHESATELLEKLSCYLEAGSIVLLNTPAGKSTMHNAKAGLRDGYTYCLKEIRRFSDLGLTMLKIHNPWEPTEPWTGAWCAGCNNWDNYEEVRHACNPDFSINDGSFWMEWSDATKQFDGCSVVLVSRNPVYDYRVRGEFSYVEPNVVLMVRAAEPVEVMLTLTQLDKRGVPLDMPDARHSPLMISVSRAEGNKQLVHKNSSSDPESPSDAFTFVVAREVAMMYTFEPKEGPYFVIPRIHRKGTSEGRQKEFVIGIQSFTPLEGKLDIQFTKLTATNPVLHNRALFVVEDAEEVIRPLQKKMPGEAAVTSAGSKLATAMIPETHEEEEEEKDEEQQQQEEEEEKEEEEEGEEGDVERKLSRHDEYPQEESPKKAHMNGSVEANGVADDVAVKMNGHAE